MGNEIIATEFVQECWTVHNVAIIAQEEMSYKYQKALSSVLVHDKSCRTGILPVVFGQARCLSYNFCRVLRSSVMKVAYGGEFCFA